MFKSKSGQSTLEYILVLTAIIAAIILVAGKFIYPNVKSAYEHVANEMNKTAQRVNIPNTPSE